MSSLFGAEAFSFLKNLPNVAPASHTQAAASADYVRLKELSDGLKNVGPVEIKSWAQIAEFRDFAGSRLGFVFTETADGYKSDASAIRTFLKVGGHISDHLGYDKFVFVIPRVA